MSPRAFLTLVVATAIAVVAAIVLIVTEQVVEVDTAQGQPMFPSLQAGPVDNLSQVTLETPRYRLVMERRESGWVSIERGDYPIRQAYLGDLVASLAAMTIVERKTDNPDWYDEIDVDGPQAEGSESLRVTATASDGTVLADAFIGIRSTSIGFAATRGGTFVRNVDEAQSWLVEGDIQFPNSLNDWFGQIVNIPGPQVASVAIYAGEELLLKADKIDFQTGDYEISYLDPSVGPEGSTAADDAVRGVTQGIVSTNFIEARPRDTVTFPEDGRRVQFTTQSGLTLIVSLGEADGQVWAAYDASAEPDSAAVATAADITAKTANWAFTLPTPRLGPLQRDINVLFVPPAPVEEPVEEAPPVLLPVLPGGP
ncbi:MAG: DUF4340 domain-containing protein [Bauldia sp.]|nr:DUF4340 domain-containing protein [Bauldia sp.]